MCFRKELYARIRKALKPGGKYIEGDFVVNEEDEKACLKEYWDKMSLGALDSDRLYHIDIPFTVVNQRRVALEAGFESFQLIFEAENSAVYSMVK